ncbi:class I SAM-dependent methyltransferase [Prochlorococcus marinus]|uniref:class I SAM-dependent methyltransferase n=1 Tax=Prochlorococcus marinus TaxID=1219 RepID=UPI0022B3AFCC|nr:class I SAM-dependent methyltransferase [Prochlorococcus marinus]
MDVNVLNGFLKDEHDLEGWFFPQDMLSLAIFNELHSKNNIKGHIVEIGVYKGKSFSFLSHFIKDTENLYGYDTFPEDFYESTNLALENYGANVQYELIKADTSELNNDDIKAKIDGKGIRILHIDAGHEYHEVFHSLLSFSPYVINNGIIVVDDYQDPEFPGIEAAVLDFCEIDRPRRFVPFFSGANKIYLCVTHMAKLFHEGILSNVNIKNCSRLTVVRDFAIIKGFSKVPTSFETINQQLNQFYELGKNDSKYNNQRLSELQNKAKKYSKMCSNNYEEMTLK